jgi:hypothetical protein
MAVTGRLEGLDRIEQRYELMIESLGEAHQQLPEQLIAWQREDMHRKYPNLQMRENGNETSVSTFVWPRSRRERNKEEVKQGIRRSRWMRRQLGPKQYTVPGGSPTRSMRPILRKELLDKLYERMPEEIFGLIKWR